MLRQKETITQIKEKMYFMMIKVLNEENSITEMPAFQGQPYRFYIGTGNNAMMVRMYLKQRWWWIASQKESFDPHSDSPSCNFIWT